MVFIAQTKGDTRKRKNNFRKSNFNLTQWKHREKFSGQTTFYYFWKGNSSLNLD